MIHLGLRFDQCAARMLGSDASKRTKLPRSNRGDCTRAENLPHFIAAIISRPNVSIFTAKRREEMQRRNGHIDSKQPIQPPARKDNPFTNCAGTASRAADADRGRLRPDGGAGGRVCICAFKQPAVAGAFFLVGLTSQRKRCLAARGTAQPPRPPAGRAAAAGRADQPRNDFDLRSSTPTTRRGAARWRSPARAIS